MHDFWQSAPINQCTPLQEPLSAETRSVSDPFYAVKQYNTQLPTNYEFVTLDLKNEDTFKSVSALINDHYVTQDTTRLTYPTGTLQWAFKTRQDVRPYALGLYKKDNEKPDNLIGGDALIGFVLGNPKEVDVMTMENQDPGMLLVVDFLCVHVAHRKQGLSLALIQELTRRANADGIYKAYYTLSREIHAPLAVIQTYHRLLDVESLLNTGFLGGTTRDVQRLRILHYVPRVAGIGLKRLSTSGKSTKKTGLQKIKAAFNKKATPHEKVLQGLVDRLLQSTESLPGTVTLLNSPSARQQTQQELFHLAQVGHVMYSESAEGQVDHVITAYDTVTMLDGKPVKVVNIYMHTMHDLTQLFSSFAVYMKALGYHVINAHNIHGKTRDILTASKFIVGTGRSHAYFWNVPVKEVDPETLSFFSI